MAKECMLSTDKLPLGGLPRNSVVRMTDSPDMTSAAYHGRKATSNKKNIIMSLIKHIWKHIFICIYCLSYKNLLNFKIHILIVRHLILFHRLACVFFADFKRKK